VNTTLHFAPWFVVAVAVGIIGMRIVSQWLKSRRSDRELRRRDAARELYRRQYLGGRARV
jgi:hypothetical protein